MRGSSSAAAGGSVDAQALAEVENVAVEVLRDLLLWFAQLIAPIDRAAVSTREACWI